jgi:hypothetical protein
MARLTLLGWLLFLTAARADQFDRLTNADLHNLLRNTEHGAVPAVTAKQLTPRSGQGAGTQGSLLVVQTRDGRLAKLDVQFGMQKLGGQRVPMVLIDRFVTFKPGDERTVVAKGNNLQLFVGVQFNADLGQVVPPNIGGDVELVGGPDPTTLKLQAIAPAKLHVITQLPAAAPGAKFEIGEQFEPRFFTGTYKLFDDGRRSGSLILEADEAAGTVSGSYYSDKDGRKYEVIGKLGPVRHQIQFAINFPQSKQQYQGFMFTGDGRAIAGISKYQDRETGFYAIRQVGDAK